MNKTASALGKLAAGKPKKFSKAELARRKKLLEKARREWSRMKPEDRKRKSSARAQNVKKTQ